MVTLNTITLTIKEHRLFIYVKDLPLCMVSLFKVSLYSAGVFLHGVNDRRIWKIERTESSWFFYVMVYIDLLTSSKQ